MNSLILKNFTIADANHPEPREGKHILIENKWIKEIRDQPIKSNGAGSIDLGHINVFLHKLVSTTTCTSLSFIL